VKLILVTLGQRLRRKPRADPLVTTKIGHLLWPCLRNGIDPWDVNRRSPFRQPRPLADVGASWVPGLLLFERLHTTNLWNHGTLRFLCPTPYLYRAAQGAAHLAGSVVSRRRARYNSSDGFCWRRGGAIGERGDERYQWAAYRLRAITTRPRKSASSPCASSEASLEFGVLCTHHCLSRTLYVRAVLQSDKDADFRSGGCIWAWLFEFLLPPFFWGLGQRSRCRTIAIRDTPWPQPNTHNCDW